MKRNLLIISALTVLSVPVLNSCSSEMDEVTAPVHEVALGSETAEDASLFPEDNGAKQLTGNKSARLTKLLAKFDPNNALTMGETETSDEHFAEIKNFVDKNLVDKDGNQLETYKNIFNWITSNVKYAQGTEIAYLDPYDVFTKKTCVCQGYANLLKTMLLTQKIPVFGVNGDMIGIGAHAWNYVYIDGKWYVSDPTGNRWFEDIKEATKHQKILSPTRVDIPLFDDGTFEYAFEDATLTINKVKKADSEDLVIPFSYGDYQVTMFMPRSPLPANVRNIYIGKNLRSLGTELVFMQDNTPNVENIYVDPANRVLSTYKGVVYQFNGNSPYFVPSAIKRLEMKPIKTVGKNTIVNLSNLEEIVFAEGTERIESYAIEQCPKLKRVYIPATLTFMATDAIYKCPEDVEIVKVPTSIHQVVM